VRTTSGSGSAPLLRGAEGIRLAAWLGDRARPPGRFGRALEAVRSEGASVHHTGSKSKAGLLEMLTGFELSTLTTQISVCSPEAN
jgi:hypothetical protein